MTSPPPDPNSMDAGAGVTRRAAILAGAGLTAAAWATPAIVTAAPAFAQAQGSPPPDDPGEPQTINLFSSQQANGLADPMVEVLLNGSWVPARAINNGNYVPFAGTGFVDAGGVCASNAVFLFRASFTLPAGFSSPQLSGRAQGDNDVAVRLNSSPVLAAQPANNSVINFQGGNPAVFTTTDPALFVPGLNHLLLDLHNFGCPLAVDFEATVDYVG